MEDKDKFFMELSKAYDLKAPISDRERGFINTRIEITIRRLKERRQKLGLGG